jgi:imidazolonepropionase
MATMVPGGAAYGFEPDGVVVIAGEIIEAVGRRSEVTIPPEAEVRSVGGRLVTPGFIDCHTHLVFGGERSTEFAERLAGASYADITAAGGGITSTVRATRTATADQLYEAALPRLLRLHRTGATTVEIKSGYGLDLGSELAMLEVARTLGADGPVDVRTTLLAAHVVPPEFAEAPDAYVDLVITEILPAAVDRRLADAVDVFCERIAFSPEQAERIFGAAELWGLPVKIHAAQLARSTSVSLAAAHAAMSADHLEYATEAQAAELGRSGTVAVLLPGATHTLQETARPPVAAFRRHHVPIALASDLNPGTSPVGDLALVGNMGAVLFGLTPDEALAGLTRHGAQALGCTDRGMLRSGLRADLAVWDVSHPAEIVYWTGMDLCSAVWVAGSLSFDRNL